jgi:hypothetical protein
MAFPWKTKNWVKIRRRERARAKVTWLAATLAVYVSTGSFCFSHVLSATTGRDAPWYADLICGIVTGPLAIPSAFICWVATLFGASAPFWPI